jgi:hypothetical protein
MARSTSAIFVTCLGEGLDWLSGEYLLTRVKFPNGGTVVFLRSMQVTLVAFSGAIALRLLADPAAEAAFSIHEFRAQMADHLPWAGTIFAAAYALLYARFASQWSYLASMYNQIKAAQAKRDDGNTLALAQWKAGFIEDCEDLHLLRKEMFLPTARAWLDSTEADGLLVRECFEKYTRDGKRRLSEIDEVIGSSWGTASKSDQKRRLRLISAMSVLIALAASVSACIQAWDAHRQSRIANDASLGFDFDTDPGKRLGIKLRNVGPGKVLINAVIYYVDNKPVADIGDVIVAAKFDAARFLQIDLKDDWMGPGEVVPIFQYRPSTADRDRAEAFVEEHMEVAVDYCTVGQRCEVKCSERGHCGTLKN